MYYTFIHTVDGSEIRLTSWGWLFIPLFTGFYTSKRWLFGISSISRNSTNLMATRLTVCFLHAAHLNTDEMWELSSARPGLVVDNINRSGLTPQAFQPAKEKGATESRTNKQTNKQTNIQTNKQTNIQTNKQQKRKAVIQCFYCSLVFSSLKENCSQPPS